ncbi:MAG: hypothetical protein IKO83_12000 [Oscillospiraceae bacterium]|nr:hypothetical protein [Oscillospiraceae bacterium]
MTCIRGSPRCSHHAVTHVFVNDPTRGYAISIQDMLADAEIAERAA